MARILSLMISISIVCIAQSLTVPLLALLLERRGINAMQNSLSTTALFAGILLASPLVERLERRYGARRTILGSLVLCILALLAFLPGYHFYVWIGLRLLLGFGMSGVYIATEIWLNRLLSARTRGRMLAFYGFFISIGLMIGPQGIQLLRLSTAAPFLFSAGLLLIPIGLLLRQAETAAQSVFTVSEAPMGVKRWWRIYSLLPFAMCAALVFGYLDGALVGDFPIYGARIGLDNATISLSLTLFIAGSLVLQFPLGYLSDRWGRQPTLFGATLVGCLCLLLLPLHGTHAGRVMVALFLAGGALGSFYSLGLAALGDVLTERDLVTGNVLYTMLYGVGSLLGPSVTGWLIAQLGREAFAFSIAGAVFCYLLFGLFRYRQIVNRKSSNFTRSRTDL